MMIPPPRIMSDIYLIQITFPQNLGRKNCHCKDDPLRKFHRKFTPTPLSSVSAHASPPQAGICLSLQQLYQVGLAVIMTAVLTN